MVFINHIFSLSLFSGLPYIYFCCPDPDMVKHPVGGDVFYKHARLTIESPSRRQNGCVQAQVTESSPRRSEGEPSTQDHQGGQR